MSLATIALTDENFDTTLERFVLVDDALLLRSELGRVPKDDEEMGRYEFTGLCEALRSEEFEEDPFVTLADLELPAPNDPDAAWERIKDFYASRACVLLRVGHNEEFIVGAELARRFGWLE